MVTTCSERDRSISKNINVEFYKGTHQNGSNFITSQLMKNNVHINSEGSNLSWHLDSSHNASYAGTWKIQIGEPHEDGVYMTFEMIIVPGCRLTSQ